VQGVFLDWESSMWGGFFFKDVSSRILWMISTDRPTTWLPLLKNPQKVQWHRAKKIEWTTYTATKHKMGGA
jgi:hypothetical protein